VGSDLIVEGFFEVSSILRSGVYVLVHKGVVIYVGKSKGMLSRIYAHKSMWGQKARGKVPDWLPIKGILFDEVFVRPCPVDLLDELELEMINLYKPKFNTRLKSPGATDRPFSVVVNGVTLAFNAKPAPIERRI